MTRSVVTPSYGTCLKFKSGTDKVSVPFTFSTNAFVISFWYRNSYWSAAGNGLGNSEGFFSQLGSFSYGRQGTNDMELYAYMNASADFAGLRRMRIGASNLPIFDYRWHHRVINVFVNASNNMVMNMWEDAVRKNTNSGVNYTGDTSTPSGNLGVGTQAVTGGNGYQGYLDDVRIFNDIPAITQNDVNNLFYRRTNPAGVNPNLWYKFDETSGTTTIDSSGNQNTGTITGATYSTDVLVLARTAASGRSASLSRSAIGAARSAA